jgi:hypothetical protein
MPNDCNNSFTISPVTTNQWKELTDSFQVRGEGYQQDFLKTYFPEPDYSVTPVARTYPEIRANRAETEEEKERLLKNEPTIRDDSWWDWRVQNWGTKWDVYSCLNDWDSEGPSEEFSASFCTAWSPMNERWMAEVSKQFPGALLTNYYEETGLDFCGVTVAKDGVVRDLCTEWSSFMKEYALKDTPDLDALLEEEEQDLDEWFWENCDSGEYYDFVFECLQKDIDQMIRQVMEQTSAPTMTELVGQK